MKEERDKAIHRTIAIWQRRSGLHLSHEEARKIAENITGFFGVLLEWDARGEGVDDANKSDVTHYAKSA